ncbi:hypothetical protein SB2_02965 [Methylobacterium radiotolerans]|nr:hypothetical protein SB3_16380 [Methylobacterium radiotolerans]KTS50494.1 hypothetical protein SB2_02965 [Methylobacterium radiotolerans]
MPIPTTRGALDRADAVRIGPEADPPRSAALRPRVEAVRPIPDLLRRPQAVTGRFGPVEAPAHPATEVPP